MFNKKYECKIGEMEALDFVRILGKYGMRFEVSDQYFEVDPKDPNHKLGFRTIKFWASKKQAIDIVEQFRLGIR
jgi:hypothetical protein